jgi:hypothetical protein
LEMRPFQRSRDGLVRLNQLPLFHESEKAASGWKSPNYKFAPKPILRLPVLRLFVILPVKNDSSFSANGPVVQAPWNREFAGGAARSHPSFPQPEQEFSWNRRMLPSR